MIAQHYGHTNYYYGKQTRCVKCAGKHTVSSCIKPDNQQPKCCYCSKTNPTSYRTSLLASKRAVKRNSAKSQKIKSMSLKTTSMKNLKNL